MKEEIREVDGAHTKLSPTLTLLDTAILCIVSLTLAFIWPIVVYQMPLFSFTYERRVYSEIKTCAPQNVVNTFSTYASNNSEWLFPQGVWWKYKNLPSIKSLMWTCKRRLLFFNKRPAGPKKGEKATSSVAPAIATMKMGLRDLPLNHKRRN